MSPYNQTTQNLKITLTLAIAFFSIPHTTSKLSNDIDYQTVVFPNQSCHEGLCIKFNFEQIKSEWEFLARTVDPNCCK